jgi:tol-pal system protein YbgF
VKKKALFVLPFCFLFIIGCATTQDLKGVQRGLEQRDTEINDKVTQLSENLARVQKNLEENRGALEAARKSQADSGADLISVRDSIQNLRGTVDEINRDVSALRKGKELKEIRDKLEDVSFRINYIENFLGVGKKEAINGSKEEAKSGPAENGEAKTDKDSAYAAASRLFKEGNYDKARDEFQKFLKQYPATEYSDSAQFWIGESYYTEEKYEKSVLEYEKVVKNYPAGGKVPSALLKQGMAFQKLGDKESAKLLFQQVVKRYPKSNQAKVAKSKLAGMK